MLDSMTAPEHPTGYDLLRNRCLNKGTAFSVAERHARGLEGLLPPAVTTIQLQEARRHAEIANLDDYLQNTSFCQTCKRNETLFYAMLMSDPPPTCRSSMHRRSARRARSSGHIFREARGIYLPISVRVV